METSMKIGCNIPKINFKIWNKLNLLITINKIINLLAHNTSQITSNIIH